jgi:hypothetical protein
MSEEQIIQFRIAIKQLHDYVRIAAINTKTDGSIARRLRVDLSNLPLMVLVKPGSNHNNREPEDIFIHNHRENNWNSNSIMSWVFSRLPNNVEELSTFNQLEQFVSNRRSENQYKEPDPIPKAILFTNKKTVPPMFNLLAKNLKSKLDFGVIHSYQRDLCQIYGVDNFPTVIIFPYCQSPKESEEKMIIYSGPLDYDSLHKYLSGKSKQLFDETRRNLAGYSFSSSASNDNSNNNNKRDDSKSNENYNLELTANNNMCKEDGTTCIVAFAGDTYNDIFRLDEILVKLDKKYAIRNFKFARANLPLQRNFMYSFPRKYPLLATNIDMLAYNAKRSKFVWLGSLPTDNISEEELSNLINQLLNGGYRWKTLENNVNPLKLLA